MAIVAMEDEDFPSSILVCPRDVSVSILSHLDSCQSLARASQACKQWQTLVSQEPASSNHVWSSLYRKTYSMRRAQNVAMPWRERFRLKWQLERNWSASRRRLAQVLDVGNGGWVNAVRLVGDSGAVLAGGAHHPSKLWSADGKTTLELKDGSSSPVMWSLDSGATSCVSGGLRGGCLCYDLTTGQLKQRLLQPRDAVPSIQMSPDEQQALLVSRNGGIHLWDLRSGALNLVAKVNEGAADDIPAGWAGEGQASEQLFSVAWHEHIALAGAGDGRVHFYDLRHGGSSKLGVVAAHTREVFTCSMQYPYLATGSCDSLVKLWDVSRMTPLVAAAAAASAPASVSAPAADAQLATLGADPGMQSLIPLSPDGVVASYPDGLLAAGYGHRYSVFSVRLSPDLRLASTSEDGSVRVWETASVLGSGGTTPPEAVGCVPVMLRSMQCWAPSMDLEVAAPIRRPNSRQGVARRHTVVVAEQDTAYLEEEVVSSEDDGQEGAGPSETNANGTTGSGSSLRRRRAACATTAAVGGAGPSTSLVLFQPHPLQALPPPQVAMPNHLQLALMPCAMHSVDVDAERLVCGGRDARVRVYNYAEVY